MNFTQISILSMLLVLVIAIDLTTNSYAQEQSIPSWIKKTAKLWANGDVGDSEFIQAIQWLIDNKILTVSQSTSLLTSSQGFSHTTCAREDYPFNGFIKIMGQYTNGDIAYSVISLKMAVLDKDGNVVATGPGVLYNVAAHETKFFDAESQYNGTFATCHIEIDAVNPLK